MRDLLAVGVAAGFPVALFVLLLWLAHLEDTLPAAVRRSTRAPDPPPILRIPVRPDAEPALASLAPEQRPAAAQPARPAPAQRQPAVQVPQQRQPDETVPAATR